MAASSRRGLDASKKATDVSISGALLADAKELRINISRATEIWLEKNLEALQSSNEYVERNGLPLAKYRFRERSED